MDLIDEQNSPTREHARSLHTRDDFADLFDATLNGGEFVKRSIRLGSNDLRQGGLPYAWWSPQNHGRDIPPFNRTAEDLIFADQMTLTQIVLEGPWAHAFC